MFVSLGHIYGGHNFGYTCLGGRFILMDIQFFILGFANAPTHILESNHMADNASMVYSEKPQWDIKFELIPVPRETSISIFFVTDIFGEIIYSPISAGTWQHFVDSDNVEGMWSHSQVESIFAAGLYEVLVGADTSSFQGFWR